MYNAIVKTIVFWVYYTRPLTWDCYKKMLTNINTKEIKEIYLFDNNCWKVRSMLALEIRDVR